MSDDGMEQLCRCFIDEGKFDDMINDLIQEGHDENYIMTMVMQESRGSENPRLVNNRITMLMEKAYAEAGSL